MQKIRVIKRAVLLQMQAGVATIESGEKTAPRHRIGREQAIVRLRETMLQEASASKRVTAEQDALIWQG